MLGNPASTANWLYTGPFRYFEHQGRARALDGWTRCPDPNCRQCAITTEAAAIHLECFELFRQTYMPIDALDRLWRVACWRSPWRDVTVPIVLPEEVSVGARALSTVAEKYGLPQMSRVPQDIVCKVRDYSRSALFWRFTAALDLAARLHAMPTSIAVSIPLCEVTGWERGGLVTQSKDSDRLPVIRLTIDSRGIRTVERLPAGQPEHTRGRFDNMVFVIKDESCFANIIARFQVRKSAHN